MSLLDETFEEGGGASLADSPGRLGEPRHVKTPGGVKHLPPVRAEALLGLVRAGSDLVKQLDASLQRHHGLSLPAFEVLLHLSALSPDGALPLSELVRQAPLSQSRVSRLALELERGGLVERTPAQGDGRRLEVRVTHAGRQRFQAAQETHLRDLDHWLFSRLDWPAITRLATITRRLLDERT